MSRRYGSQSMIGELQAVLVRPPDSAFGDADPALWHYTARPNLERAQAEHANLVTILQQHGAEIIHHTTPLPHHADAIFVFDPVLVADQGAILLRMGKPLRRGEEEALGHCLQQIGVPIHYRLHGDACAEGGDLLWLDPQTLVVGRGFRTNEEGLRQLRQAFAGTNVQVLGVDLPYYQGPATCLHLLSLISIVDHDLAVVYESWLPVALWQLLQARAFRLISVPEQEWSTMGPNVLALAPGQCLLLQENQITKARLEAAGCQVYTYAGAEISHKAEGGPTCLTRPVLRHYDTGGSRP